MTTDQRKELIKLKTEFLKFYFIAIIALLTGVVTLALKETPSPIQKALLVIGTALAMTVVVLILTVTADIRRIIDQLNNSAP